MKVTFLNVGQGDTIILEWIDRGINKIGIIDCKAVGRTNPTLDYLKKVKANKIEFIILTHPHSDHFSGLNDLIAHIKANNITLKYFMHSGTVSPNSIKTAVRGGDLRNEIGQLFSLIHDLKKSGTLAGVYSLNEMPFPGELNDEWRFHAFSPSIQEIDKYSLGSDYNRIEQDEEPENEKYANLLGTFITVFNHQSYFLLTSDCVIDVFNRIDNREDYRSFFDERKMLLCQIPHHGSMRNFKNSFWRNRNISKLKIPAIISVGKNRYKHPHEAVVKSLDKLGYQLYTTEPISNFSEITYTNNLFMNMISSPHRYEDFGLAFSIVNNEVTFNKVNLP